MMRVLESVVAVLVGVLLPTAAAAAVALSQALPDSLSGGSGWAGAGLLGAVLGWLCFVHLPSKDKMVLQIIKDFRDELSSERLQREQHAEQIDGRLEQVGRELAGVRQAVADRTLPGAGL